MDYSTRKTGSSLLVALTLLAPTASIASSFQYDGIRATYLQADQESDLLEDFEISGFSIEAMYSYSPTIVLGGRYSSSSGETSAPLQAGGTLPLDITASGPGIFAFMHGELNENTDFLVGGSFDKTEVESKSGSQTVAQLSDDSDTKLFFGGIRHRVNQKLEVELHAEYDFDADEGEDKFGYGVTGRYYLSTDLDISASFFPSDDGDTIAVSVKKYFSFGS